MDDLAARAAKGRKAFHSTSDIFVCPGESGSRERQLSLRKSRYRIIGALVGATMIVVLTAWLPQNRIGFLVGLALWGGVCAFAAKAWREIAAQKPVVRRRDREVSAQEVEPLLRTEIFADYEVEGRAVGGR